MKPLNLLVGVVEDEIGGIGPYAEYVAAAGALSGHRVTLLAASSELAANLRQRMNELPLEIIDLGVPRFGPVLRRWRRLWPGAVALYLGIAMKRRMRRLDHRYDIAHLNIPALAAAARGFASQVSVAAWFYPHGLRARAHNSWLVTGSGLSRANLLRRLVILAKSIAMYRDDRNGYRRSDLIIAPTLALTDQLNHAGLKCFCCEPPVWRSRLKDNPPDPALRPAAGPLRLITSCADLSNPRKNVMDTLEAATLLARAGVEVTLELIGEGYESLLAGHEELPRSLTITTTGLLSREDAHQRVCNADVYVTSTLYEEWGYAVVEALMLGTPVVAYPVYPFSELLKNGLGVVAAAPTPSSLAQAIQRAASKQGLAENLAETAALRFDAGSIGGRLTEIWTTALTS